MNKNILTPFQSEILKALSQNKFLVKNFYFSGGTALSEFYLHHRYSEDLDFFTKKELSFEAVRACLEEDFKKIGISSLEYREEASVKLFFLRRGKREVVKTDFNYFPFEILDKGLVWKGLRIDSLLDITVNKLHTILTRGVARDFVDFYFIQEEKHYKLDFLLKNLQKKFSWSVDPLYLASRLRKVENLRDFPRMVKKIPKEKIIDYFLSLSGEQGKRIFK